MLPAAVVARVLAKVVPDPATGCRSWPGICRDGRSRLAIKVGGNRQQFFDVARVVWEAEGKPLPPGVILVRTCPNPRCVAPAHRRREMSRGMVRKRNPLTPAERFVGRPPPREPYWTPERDAALRAGYGPLGSGKRLAAALGVLEHTIYKRAQVLGLARPTDHRAWTADEKAVLRRDYGRVPSRELAARLGRGLPSLLSMAQYLGVTRPNAACRLLLAPRYGLRNTMSDRAVMVLIALTGGPLTTADLAAAVGIECTRGRFTKLGLRPLVLAGLVCKFPTGTHEALYSLTAAAMDLLEKGGLPCPTPA